MNIGKKIQINLFLAIMLGIVLFLIGYIISAHIVFTISLDSLSKLADILTALSVFVAAYAFVYQVHKDSTDAAIDQLSFFREKFMPDSKKLMKDVRESLRIDKLPIIENISDFSLEWIRANKRSIADAQLKPFETNEIFNERLLETINMLEVFSQELIHKNTINHPALIPARATFVMFVELSASIICTLMYLNKDSYLGIEKVYESWRDRVDRDDLAQKIQKTRAKINVDLSKKIKN